MQNFMARIYTDENLRRAFLVQPEKIGLEANLTKTEIIELAEILPEELTFFAESLFYKRLRELEKFQPLTKEKLEKDFEILFREFANQFVPSTLKKTTKTRADFVNFCRGKKMFQDW